MTTSSKQFNEVDPNGEGQVRVNTDQYRTENLVSNLQGGKVMKHLSIAKLIEIIELVADYHEADGMCQLQDVGIDLYFDIEDSDWLPELDALEDRINELSDEEQTELMTVWMLGYFRQHTVADWDLLMNHAQKIVLANAVVEFLIPAWSSACNSLECGVYELGLAALCNS